MQNGAQLPNKCAMQSRQIYVFLHHLDIYMYVCMNGMKWNEKGSPCLCLDYVCFHSWRLPNISNMCNCSAHTHTHIHSHKYTPFSKN